MCSILHFLPVEFSTYKFPFAVISLLSTSCAITFTPSIVLVTFKFITSTASVSFNIDSAGTFPPDCEALPVKNSYPTLFPEFELSPINLTRCASRSIVV